MHNKQFKSFIFWFIVFTAVISSVMVANRFIMAWTAPGSNPPVGSGAINIVGNDWGIGKTPANRLDIETDGTGSGISLDGRAALTGYNGDAWLRLNQNNSFTNGVLTPGNIRAEGIIDARGGITVGLSTNKKAIYVHGTGAFANGAGTGAVSISGDSGGASGIYAQVFLADNTGAGYGMYYGGDGHFYIQHSQVGGYFGMYPNGDFYASGNISGASIDAVLKNFLIDHPTKPDMTLRYGSLEGPEYGVYVRGQKENNKIIELPDYWTGLVHEDTITVQLTAIGAPQDLWVEEIKDNKVYIDSNAETIEYFYFIQAERKDVEKIEVESDK